MTMTEERADAFDAFYRDTSRRLLRYAYGLTGDPGEAQDLVQEAYARAWQRWRRLPGYDDPEAWLRLVVNRLSTDRWRRLRVRRAHSAAAAPLPPADPPSEDTVLLVRAMRTLPEAHRHALALRYLLDRSVADIAAETGVPEGTVKSWLSRGRAALATALNLDPAPGAVRSPEPSPPGGARNVH
ncbi:RNA polymerase sigma24 factor [Winogradskya humida]|uniref:RNA polymerase sigma factor n=2 Tax=Winogradskya humida TaxID=113566 RepID=A0ABQ3ZSE8_9ACTN|nr:RNA polymerase sigma24 factor [Actinoplanes humidus]